MQLERSCCSALRWLISFSLDLMRAFLSGIILATLFASSVGAASRNDPTAVYAQDVQATLTQMALQAIQRQPQLLQGGSVWLTCRIGPRGNVQKVDVVSRHRVPGISEGFAAALKSAKFPPIPKEVIKQRGDNFLDVKTSIRID
jgi:hypothetical protein